MGQALYSSKLSYPNPLYLLMGDPGLHLAVPALSCSLTLSSDTLMNKGLYLVTGNIGDNAALHNGSAEVRLFDLSTVDSIDRAPNVKYTIPGKLIIRAAASVTDNALSASFYMPNMSSIRPDSVFLSGLRLDVYANCGTTDATGALPGTVWSGGTYQPPPGAIDSTGPEISLYSGEKPIYDGDLISSSSSLRVVIKDTSGINIVPNSSLQGDQIRLILDNRTSYSLNGDFIYQDGGPYSGSVAIPFPQLSEGGHDLRVTAYDCYGNKGTVSRSVNYIGSGASRLTEVYNYPNPFSSKTWFTFNLHQDAEVTIRIYTVTGRLIVELEPGNLKAGYNQVGWDGRDAEGDRPANGVYFYKITSASSSGTARVLGKLMIMN
jgi:hypothetical protein